MIWHHHVAWGQYRAGPRAHSSEQRPMTDYCGLTTADALIKVRRRVSVPPDSGGTESIVTNPGGILT